MFSEYCWTKERIFCCWFFFFHKGAAKVLVIFKCFLFVVFIPLSIHNINIDSMNVSPQRWGCVNTVWKLSGIGYRACVCMSALWKLSGIGFDVYASASLSGSVRDGVCALHSKCAFPQFQKLSGIVLSMMSLSMVFRVARHWAYCVHVARTAFPQLKQIVRYWLGMLQACSTVYVHC